MVAEESREPHTAELRGPPLLRLSARVHALPGVLGDGAAQAERAAALLALTQVRDAGLHQVIAGHQVLATAESASGQQILTSQFRLGSLRKGWPR